MKGTTDNAVYPTYDYVTFPRRFVSYKWFKPLLVGLLAFIFMIVFQVIVAVLAAKISGDPSYLGLEGGYDDMNAYTLPGALGTVGAVAVILPALALAARIVGDRPFSSYTSSRGGWNWGAFGKCMLVALGIFGVLTVIDLVANAGSEPGPNQFTVAGFIMLGICLPFQCMAEEYVCRGFLMQTVGAWIKKFPFIAILIQALIFASLHVYNLVGLAAVFISGLVWGVLAWRTNGLEASGAAHITNNAFAFYLTGFGLSATSSEVDIASLVVAIVADVLYAVIVLGLGKKYNWFTSKGDGTVAFNEKKRAKMARKQQRKQQGLQPQAQPVLMQQQVQPGMPIPQAQFAQAVPANGQWAYSQQLYQQPQVSGVQQGAAMQQYWPAPQTQQYQPTYQNRVAVAEPNRVGPEPPARSPLYRMG